MDITSMIAFSSIIIQVQVKVSKLPPPTTVIFIWILVLAWALKIILATENHLSGANNSKHAWFIAYNANWNKNSHVYLLLKTVKTTQNCICIHTDAIKHFTNYAGSTQNWLHEVKIATPGQHVKFQCHTYHHVTLFCRITKNFNCGVIL